MNPIIMCAVGVVFGVATTYILSRAYFTKQFRKKEEELKELLLKMEKLEQVRSTFVANVTHELKTPLTSIKGYIELLKNGNRDEEMRNGFYDIIDIETDRLHTLIDDILQLSEIEQSKDDPRLMTCVLKEVGEEIATRFLPQAEQHGVELTVLIPDDLVVKGNKYRLQQLFNNLIDNAIKYNQDGGKVIMRAWHEKKETVVAVSDTGIGIPEGHISHVFERFYRVDKGRSRTLGGTGLGLSIVKHVVQLHGGRIDVESKAGKGTMFTVHLPD
ncbi:hypothetical protein LJC27_02760 [Christensenellaceae bacterium OttesenSCG-928-M15]|nr:hypothetical protein [Christensenellaceae bacterium OttesenSCG-928-M15]